MVALGEKKSLFIDAVRDSGCIASDVWTAVKINLKGCEKKRSWPNNWHLLGRTETNQGKVIFNIYR